MGEASDDARAFWAGSSLLNRKPPGSQMFHVCVIPIFNVRGKRPEADAVSVAAEYPSDEVKWYLYAILDHGYCDGPTGLPLFADLLRLCRRIWGASGPLRTTERMCHVGASVAA